MSAASLSAVTTHTGSLELFVSNGGTTSKITSENLIGGGTALGTAPATTDRIPIQDVSAATGSKAAYVTVEELHRSVTSLTEDTTPDGAADYVLAYDTSANSAKKVLLRNVRAIETYVFQIQSELVQSGTAIGTTSQGKQSMYFPYGFKITDVRASCTFNTSSFTLTSDVLIGCTEGTTVNQGVTGGTSCLSTACQITSGNLISNAPTINTAANTITAGQIVGIFCSSSTSIAANATTVTGWKVYVTGYRTS
jgi:hypothetical protein